MQVLVNAGHSGENHEALSTRVTDVVAGALARFSDRISRVEVHLGDENGAKGGSDDKRCMMEACLEGRPPVAVTHHAGTVDSAVHGAAAALAKLIDGVLGRRSRTRPMRD